MVVCLNRAIIVLCQAHCYINDIRIYKVIRINNNNVAIDITRMKKNMVALKNLDLSKNLGLSCPS